MQIGAFAAKIVYLKEWDDYPGTSVEIMKVRKLRGVCNCPNNILLTKLNVWY